MPGMINASNITLQNITDIANVTTYPQLLTNVNTTVYAGYFFFALLWTLWIILYFSQRDVRDRPIQNLASTGAIITLLSIMIRVIEIVNLGVIKGLLTDKQMWIFPLITIIAAMWVWIVRE